MDNTECGGDYSEVSGRAVERDIHDFMLHTHGFCSAHDTHSQNCSRRQACDLMQDPRPDHSQPGEANLPRCSSVWV
jgi:hypothetical protein